MKETLPQRVRLGVFEVDLRAGELRQDEGAVLVLSDQPLQILRILIEADGEMVTREEIRQRLWPDDTIVEFDSSINNAIKKLRRALVDSADEPHYIGTIAKRGYRLLVPVERVAAADGSLGEVGPQAAGGVDGAMPFRPDPGALTGRNVSHYRVLDIIGGGGMGVVYRAEDLKLGRPVALKFLPEELGSDPRALERFSREARAASSLDHPNICAIFEFGEHEGRPFMVMQLLEGQTLRDRLAAREGALPLEELLDIGIQVSDGLQAAHERGIIHRDIKPANIFITNKGVCKILDFGVAKLLEEAPGFGPANLNEEMVEAPAFRSANRDKEEMGLQPRSGHHLTRTGSAMGTAGYMSPEQVRGEKLDARTDRSRQYAEKAAASARRDGVPVSDVHWTVNMAWMAEEVGLQSVARELLLRVPSIVTGEEPDAAFVLARLGEVSQARNIADKVDRKYPFHEINHSYSIALTQAAIAMENKDPNRAIEAMEVSKPHELGAGVLAPAYLRGLAFLQAGNPSKAAAEFQNIMAHPTLVDNRIHGALAHLQLGRAQVVMGDKNAARKSYQDFLTLWKDADPDIPIYKQAKVEYAKLQ